MRIAWRVGGFLLRVFFGGIQVLWGSFGWKHLVRELADIGFIDGWYTGLLVQDHETRLGCWQINAFLIHRLA